MTDLYVYQSANGEWIIFSNGIKTFFANESEAQNMATKLTWAGQAQAKATTLAQVADELADLETVYFDRGYDGGGSNPITNDDVVSLNITTANLAALVTLIQQFNNFLGNSAVTPGDYDATLNTVRTDV